MKIKVKDLLQLFNGPVFEIYCERPETCYGYECLYNSEWILSASDKIMESDVTSFKIEDATLCIKIEACDDDINEDNYDKEN